MNEFIFFLKKCWIFFLMQAQGTFLKWWNTTKSISKICPSVSCLFLMRRLPKYARNLIPIMDFWRQTKTAGQKVAVWWAGFAALTCRNIAQKVVVIFQFLAFFAIPSSSRHKNWRQKFKRLFVIFYHFRNLPWAWLRILFESSGYWLVEWPCMWRITKVA